MLTSKIRNLNEEIEHLKDIISRLNVELLSYQESRSEVKITWFNEFNLILLV